jgi:cell division protein FtsB
MLAKKVKKRKVVKTKPKGKFSNLIAIVFILFAVYLIYTNIMIFLERSRINSDYSNLDKTYEDLAKEKDVLKMQLGETYSNDYLERVAREELGLYKEGEKVIVIKKEEQEKTVEDTNDSKDKNLLEQFMDIIKGLAGNSGGK